MRARSTILTRVVPGLLVAVCCGGRAAAADGHLALQEVLGATRRHHPSLIEASYALQKAEGKVLGGLGTFDPQLEVKGKLIPHGDYEHGIATATLRQQTGFWGLALVGGWEIGSGDFPIYKKNFETSNGGAALLGIELPLLRGGAIDKRRAKLWAARYGREAARFEVAAVRLELSRRAAHSYWEWVAAGRRLVIATDLLRIASARVAQVERRIARGDLPPIERVENQRAILQREGIVVKARRALERAALKLSLYWRDGRGKPLVPSAERVPPSIPVAALLPQAQVAADADYALANRPELKVLRAGRDAVHVARRLASNDRLPKFDLSAFGSYDIGSEPYQTRRADVLLGFAFSLPLLLREARGALRAADGAAGAFDAKTRFVADKVVMQVQDAHSAIRAAHQALQLATREVKVSHQVERAERERLRLGASTMLLVNLREQAAAEAETRAVDAAAELQRAMADYLAVTARGFAG